MPELVAESNRQLAADRNGRPLRIGVWIAISNERVGGAVVQRTLRVLKEPRSNEGHERIVEGSCALNVIAAERNVMDHLVTT